MCLDYEKNAKIMKALSDPSRLKILNLLSYEEKCACKLLESFDFTQPTLSHHMKVLIDCGLVNVRKEGLWNNYSLNISNCNNLVVFIEKIINEREDSINTKVNSRCD